MAPDPSSDPFVFAGIHLLLQKQQHHKLLPFASKPSRSRSSSSGMPCLSPLLAASSDAKRSHKRRGKRSSSHSHSSSSSSSSKHSKSSLHYLKPGALAQLRDAQRSATRPSSLCSSKKKRLSPPADDGSRDSALMQSSRSDGSEGRAAQGVVPEQTAPAIVMTPGPSVRVFGPFCPQRKKLLAPKTPLPSTTLAEASSSSPPPSGSDAMEATVPADLGSIEFTLDLLPLELLVRIVCNLHHDQLKPAFHVCKRLRQAVLIARQCHFDFTTPDRERQETLQLATPKADLNWPFFRSNENGVGPSRPPTPRAPKHGPKPLQARISAADMHQLAGPLFHQAPNNQNNNHRMRRVRPPTLPRPAFRAVASHRVLFYEEELCQAVAQNSILKSLMNILARDRY